MTSFYEWVSSHMNIDSQIEQKMRSRQEELSASDDMCLFGDRIRSVSQQRRIKPALRYQNQGKRRESSCEERMDKYDKQQQPFIFKNLAIKKKMKAQQIGQRIHHQKSNAIKLTYKRMTLHSTSNTKLKIMANRSSLNSSLQDHIPNTSFHHITPNLTSKRYSTLGDQPQNDVNNNKKQHKAIFFFQQSPKVKLRRSQQSKSKTMRATSSRGFRIVEEEEPKNLQKKVNNFLQVKHIKAPSLKKQSGREEKTLSKKEDIGSNLYHWKGIKRRKVKARFNALAQDEEDSITGWAT